MAKTYRFDSGSFDNFHTTVENYEAECLDCGEALYPNEIEFGICDHCDMESQKYTDDAVDDDLIDENDTEALAWLSGSIYK